MVTNRIKPIYFVDKFNDRFVDYKGQWVNVTTDIGYGEREINAFVEDVYPNYVVFSTKTKVGDRISFTLQKIDLEWLINQNKFCVA